ncbi:FAD-dependent oxidoreductase [Streptomyces sp. A7024]|uniref:ferredoxin--NADP(+) reductase n=1 Tax=Streptomyces coryli TaxID=1128680 RepID=A0A6G4TX19_9ACTN|nr:FAD-dependent oxidoreductase [Streptomyces coryli]NGN64549.1 FAD-dependent oxidoreductase [Streptomyces coryli]
MTYAITQTCCNDATCIAVCPVNCIHPTPEERAFGSTEMLHIDPKACIDCGACADACPVDAIFPVEELTGPQRQYAAMNAAYYADADQQEPPAGSPNFHAWGPPVFDRVLPSDFRPLRVAVIGTGPAGMYAAEDLLLHTSAEVTLIDRLPVAGGLVRYGVAPDHPGTKGIGGTFARFHNHPRVRLLLGLHVGDDVSTAEVAAHHDAVIYAVGASTGRRLDIPGEDLTGSITATDFVAWYNAHPDIAPDAIDLSSTERVVVVGNGNVALDVARILVADPAELAGTDIADHALAALRASKVREVVLLGRRGPEHLACTRPELLALKHLRGVEVTVDAHDPRTADAIDAAGPDDTAALLTGLPRTAVDWSAPPAEGRRIVFRFHSAPVAADGAEGVGAVRVTGRAASADGSDGSEGRGGSDGSDGSEAAIPAGLLVRAIGYRGAPVTGLPFDDETGTVPHTAGRVTGHPGTYVVGWIKRGPSGGIGANRACAAETISTLLADAVDGSLTEPARSTREFRRLARRRTRHLVDARGLAAIERTERARGAREGRTRVKLATVPELVAAARSRRLVR